MASVVIAGTMADGHVRMSRVGLLQPAYCADGAFFAMGVPGVVSARMDDAGGIPTLAW